MKTRIFTLCMVFALTGTFLWCAYSEHSQRTAAEEMIRLRVVADSDDPADQERKLLVRDAVLDASDRLLKGGETRETAAAILEENLSELGNAARSVLRREGCGEPVRVYLTSEYAGTRRYGTFTLPAGRWLTLRVDIGSAEGKNWWCVVFPPLCTAGAEEVFDETLCTDTSELIRGGEEKYELRFRTLELLESLGEWINRMNKNEL